MAFWEFETTEPARGRFRQLRIRDKDLGASLGSHYVSFREYRLVTDKPDLAAYLQRGIADGTIPFLKENVRSFVKVRCEYCAERFGTREELEAHVLSIHKDKLDLARETAPLPAELRSRKSVSRGVQTAAADAGLPVKEA